jgi:hypothetical protein
MMKLHKLTLPALAAGALALGGCVVDEQLLITEPTVPAAGGPLFQRYVALGNSITAGFQSGGMTAAMQMQAYPVLLAQQAGAEFHVPLVNPPGCPPPMAEPLGQPVVPGVPCAFRQVPAPPFVSNLAVPGATIADVLAIPQTATATLNTVIVGNRSQVQAMREANPTLVSVWIGNNDALAAAVSGNTALLTSLADFQQRLNTLETEIKATQAQDAILIGPVDAVVAAPILQPGAFFWGVAQQFGGNFPISPTQFKPVSNNCAPLNPATGQPNPWAFNMISFRVLADTLFPQISCDPAYQPEGAAAPGLHILSMEEQALIRTRVAEYNAAIQARAEANNWIFVNPNALLAPYVQQGPPYDMARKCQMLADPASFASEQAFTNAILQSCPVTGPTAAPGLFGILISFDGVHPSAAAHRIVANALIWTINNKHGLQIPQVP